MEVATKEQRVDIFIQIKAYDPPHEKNNQITNASLLVVTSAESRLLISEVDHIDENGKGYILEVDLEYPESLHDYHSWLQ
ncbi:hypothetical protein NPIL_310791 [Nephila pilipes]|uniref:Uncharacterized protein n=1 Tax=Nephila pilipes TaxID=299642 RepID=A0A8X6QI79_NEPPI|nr:hypothetical protein NPIL_310791 [Nephila pilipes]